MGFAKRLFFWLFPKAVLVRRAPASHKVFLTFDDGPHPITTERILRVLEAHGVKATFFVTGVQVRKYPEIARQAAEGGHEIASHSWFHQRMSHWDFRAIQYDVVTAEEMIHKTCAVATRTYRPPYGRITVPLLLLAIFRRMKIVLWSVDSEDDRGQSPAIILENCRRVVAGDIVLFHDDNRAVADALPEVIAQMRARGLEFGLVREIYGGFSEVQSDRAAA